METKVSKAYNRKKQEAPAVEETPAKRVQKERQKAVIEKVAKFTPPDVVTKLSSLKLTLNDTVDGILNSVVQELGTLSDLQEAIAIQRTELENLYAIRAEADTLQLLLETQDAEKATFDAAKSAEITLKETRLLVLENEYRENRLAKQVERQREEEQYRYDLEKKRRLAADAYEQERKETQAKFDAANASITAALDERDKALKLVEEHLAAMETKVRTFDATLDAEVKKAVAIATSALKKDLEHAHKIESLTVVNEKNLMIAEIAALKARIVELTDRNSVLDAQYKQASDKVQAIAEKAIDGASKQAVVVNAAGDTSARSK